MAKWFHFEPLDFCLINQDLGEVKWWRIGVRGGPLPKLRPDQRLCALKEALFDFDSDSNSNATAYSNICACCGFDTCSIANPVADVNSKPDIYTDRNTCI